MLWTYGLVWTYILILHGVFCAGSNNISVSVKEGDSVTLPNDFKITNQDKIRWYFKDTQIAKIDFYNGKSCTDVQCNEGTEGFRDRLKLDHQTGSLTIINTRSTDSGEYKLEVILAGDDKEESFSVTVLSVSAADRHEMEKNTEEESDTADPDSGLSKAAIAGLCVTAVLLVIGAGAGAAMICYRKLQARKKVQSGNRARGHDEQMHLERGVATEGERKDTSLSLLDTDYVERGD